MIGLVIRRCLWSLTWFPQYLKGLKAIVSFMRDKGGHLTRHLRTAGHTGLAAAIEATHYPHFAEWRWRTLGKCCKAISGCVESLAAVFDPTPFQGGANPTRIQTVSAALRSPVWFMHSKFVRWFTTKMDRLLSWGQGCACHGPEENGSCAMQGRRLQEAVPYTTQYMKSCIEEAGAWGDTEFGELALLRQCQAAVRAASVLCSEKYNLWTPCPGYWLALESLVFVIGFYCSGTKYRQRNTTGSPKSCWILEVSFVDKLICYMMGWLFRVRCFKRSR